jgi:N6-L-threonylcarbamoyladenine synthase
MIILGIETSCDETSVSLVHDRHILANIIATQKVHEQYGGVVPEFASRAHMKQLMGIMRVALQESGKSLQEVDAIAVTYGPGLAGSLLVGVSVAKGLAYSLNIPFIGVNHIEGHLLATEEELEFPYLALVASGGHTILVLVEAARRYRIVGRTIDDAAGEAFDKVAKLLGLGYPGGPQVEKTARLGNSKAIAFPRALMEEGNLNFSFSGLKTAVLYYTQSLSAEQRVDALPDITASFQQAVIDVLIEKSRRAMRQFHCHTLVLAGGVVRNTALRERFADFCTAEQFTLIVPSPELCTDNAGMIARAGYLHLQNGERSDFDLDVAPNLSL